MSEMLMHPGIILVLVGLLAMIAPKCVRKVLLAVGPLAALYVAFNLQLGTDVSIDFVRGYKLGILHVDKLSWIFTFIFPTGVILLQFGQRTGGSSLFIIK